MRGVIARRALALLAGALVLAACGSGSGSNSTSSSSDTTRPARRPRPRRRRLPRRAAQSGLSIKRHRPVEVPAWLERRLRRGPRAVVRARGGSAAARAGCRLRADPSAVGIHLLISDIVPLHVDNPDYSKVPRPPTNGHHRPLWANWGFYREPVPYAYEVHNLEHGGVGVTSASAPPAAGTSSRELWADRRRTSWWCPGSPPTCRRAARRHELAARVICKSGTLRILAAIRTYRDTYRGAGPEQIPSLNTGASAPDLPTPARPTRPAMGEAAQPAYVYDLLAEPRAFVGWTAATRARGCALAGRRARHDRRSRRATRRRSRSGAHPTPRPNSPDGEAGLPRARLGRAARARRPWRPLDSGTGPGQLGPATPILDLRDHGKDLRRYAHDLERVLIDVLATFGITAAAGEDREHVGVWVEDRKIASLGIRANHWVVHHGFALNVDCDLEGLGRFRACGLDATPSSASIARWSRGAT